MKLILAVLLFVGAAVGSSVHRYAWQPQREYVYRYESKVDFSIPEIRADQKAGLRLNSVIRIQAKTDYSLLIKFDQPRFFTFNGIHAHGHHQVEEPIPQEFKLHLEKPFKVHLRRGVVEAVFVDHEEPVAVTNIKKAVLANLNLDLSASRRHEVLSNRFEVPDEQTLEQSPLDQSYFTTREQSLHGDCQTSYNVHPLAEYEAMELEDQWERMELERNQREHLPGGLSQGRKICQGKTYWQITKTRNMDNCVEERPVYQKWAGLKGKCDTTRANCKDLFTHASSVNYVVCGQDIRDFVIRKSINEEIISTSVGWKTEETIYNNAEVVIEILKEEAIIAPFQLPATIKELKTLFFAYPEKTMASPKSVSEMLTVQEKEQIKQESNIVPVLPMPDLRSAPQMLVPVDLSVPEVTEQAIEQLLKVTKEIFESPESCTSKGDVAGSLNVVSKALRPLSFPQLVQVESRLEAQISAFQQQQKKLIRTLFYDVVSMIGTNPAVMLVKERVVDTSRVDAVQAVKMIQVAMTNIRTPTPELLEELIKLVKTELRPLAHDRTQVYTVAMIQTSNLLNKACVNPEKVNIFPAKIYGQFCHKEAQAVQQWLDFVKQEFETQQNQQIRLNAITAIGKVGAPKSIEYLAEIASRKELNEMVRSMAVYSLKRAAILEPVMAKPLLLTIMDNVADHTCVRIAALAVLPYAQPTAAELQKIAIRTWLEPSKEFASFAYSTFRTLAQTQIPELKLVGLQVRPLLALIKPYIYGMHYSHNLGQATLVDYLQMVISREYSWVKSKMSIVPHRYSEKTRVYTGSAELVGSTYTFYTRGMDKWIDMIMRYTSRTIQTSQQVRQELEKIVREINIEERQQPKPEFFVQYEMFDYEYSQYISEAKVTHILEQLAEQLNRDIQSLTEEKTFEYTQATKVLEAEGLGPCDAGFPVYAERSLPMVIALKGSAQMELEEQGAIRLPTMVKAKVIPVVNIKLEANMGVISPFTQQLIGTGVEMAMHYATPLEAIITRKLTQLSVDFKLPSEVTRQLEAVHVFVTPFTVRKDLKQVRPVAKSADVKPILSAPVKEMKMNIGQQLEIDAKLIVTSDNRYQDLFSYWQKIKQHSFQSLANAFYLPSTLRMSSAKILFNPQQSRTKEISLTFGLVKVTKEQGSLETQVFPAIFSKQPIDSMQHIKQVCLENYPKNPARFSECVIELSTLEFVTGSVDSICQQYHMPKCQQMEAVCHEAKRMCETKTQFRTDKCKRNAETCLRRVLNLQNVHKTMLDLGNHGTAYSLRMDADLHGSNKAISTAVSIGIQKESSAPAKEIVKMISNVEVMTPAAPVYEVKFVTKAEVPRVLHRWNKEQLVNEALNLILNGQIEYGSIGQKQIIKLNSHMTKSAEQKRSVQESPEFKRCTEEQQKNKQLAPVCEFARHQAASIDEIKTEIQLPMPLYKYPVLIKVADFVKAFFIGQVYEGPELKVVVDPKIVKLDARVSRVGDEAQIVVVANGKSYEIRNIRLPEIFKGVLPISLRNPLKYNVMQKITQHQIPASCRVEPYQISTFDNKTFGYELNNCYHLLFKDCSQKIPVAVLAKKLTGEKKEVKILAGLVEVVMTPESSGNLLLKLNVEGRREEVRNIQPGQVKKIMNAHNEEIVEIQRYADNVYKVNAIRESLWVLFDGKHAEISGSYMLRSRACGLCGDLNGENTADLKTPQKCLMSRPRFAAYSYMIQESCQGIPSQDKPMYQKEISECVKEEVIPAPLQRLSRFLVSVSTTKPIISQHLVQRQNQSGQTCISVQKVKVCSKINQSEVEEPKPIKVIRKRVQYVCYESSDPLAQQLEQRARSGETLELTVAGQPIAFSKIEYEPTACERQTNRI